MLAAAALALSIFGHRDDGQIATRTLKLGEWTATIRADRFTGAVSCVLDARRMHFARDTLTFRLGGDVDTSNAYFRIDAGAAHSVREARFENETHGVFQDRGPIGNPSDGEVALPASVVRGAKQVLIRASPKQPPQAFDVSRLADALAAAKAGGCPDGVTR
jgi:hypothetical protein